MQRDKHHPEGQEYGCQHSVEIYWSSMPVLKLYSKTCVNQPLSKRPIIGFQDELSLNAGQKYCRMLSTFIKLPFVIKIFVLSVFEWQFYTGFTVLYHVAGLTECKYSVPTDVQRESIGLALQGQDILGAAKTGSGKTLAFIIPVSS